MKYFIAIATLVFSVAAAHAQAPQKSAAECGIEPLGNYLKLSFDEFDQTMGGGWRAIADKEGCEVAAADLIAQYRKEILDKVIGLDWHEAQGRALGGQTAKALELFRGNLAYENSLPEADRSEENILKGEATVAFLTGDLDTLQKIRAKLVAMPKPEGFDEGIERFKKKYPTLTPPTWPLNLHNVDAFIACFGRSYAEAYDDGCKGGPKPEPAKP